MIYDITREMFSIEAYPGDPIPSKEKWFSISAGDVCNLTEIKIGSHTGTHIDAPRHFIPNGKSVSEIPLCKCMGECQVIEWNGELDDSFWNIKINKSIKKILFKGNVKLRPENAKKITEIGLDLVGVETSTVGAPDKQKEVHKTLLNAEVVILENLELSKVKEGIYILSALPLKMDEMDGSPVRAVLIEK